jgi:hypothetical protein
MNLHNRLYGASDFHGVFERVYFAFQIHSEAALRFGKATLHITVDIATTETPIGRARHSEIISSVDIFILQVREP